jgi:hypothetical protein
MARELFKLIGFIGMDGVEDTKKHLSNIDKQVRKAQFEMNKFGKEITNTGKQLSLYLTAPIVAAGAAMLTTIRDIADLNENISKTDQIFQSSSDTIKEWSKTTGESIGQSRNQALEAASNFATFGKAAGLGGENLSSFAIELTSLASDLASFNNTSPEEAINAIGSALRGEAEPMRKYGVLLNDATLKQEAFSMGLITSTKEALSPQNKVLAARAVILKQTSDAQGDFAKTSDGLANQQRIILALYQDIRVELGELFLPAADAVATLIKDDILPAIRSAVNWFKNLSPEMRSTIAQWLLLAAAIGPVLIVVGKFISWARILIPLYRAMAMGQLTLNAAMKANMFGLIITGIAAAVAAGIYLYNNWEEVSQFMGDVWDSITFYFWQGVSAVKSAVFKTVSFLLKLYETAFSIIPGISGLIKNLRLKMDELAASEDLVYIKQKRNRIATLDQKKAAEELAEATRKAAEAAKNSSKQDEKTVQSKEEVKKKIEEQIKKEKELAIKRAEFEKSYRDKVLKQSIDSSDLTKMELDKALELNKRNSAIKLEILNNEFNEEISKAGELGAATTGIEEFYKNERLALAQEETQTKIDLINLEAEARLKSFKEGLSIASNVTSRLSRISSLYTNNELKKIDNKKQAQIEAVNSSTLSEEEKALKISEIEKKADAEKIAMQKAQFKREKALNFAMAVINTASAVVEALPNMPLSIAVGALGAVESGLILAEPEPFAEGGLVKKRPGGINAIIGEGNQDEVVFPVETGVDMFFNKFLGKISSFQLPTFANDNAQVVSGGNTFNIGTLIADDAGLKMLERKMRPFRISEDQREGR